MATSEHEGRLLTGRTFAANEPVDASFARDFIVNNANHYADEHAQVRVDWAAGATVYTGAQGYIAPPTAITVVGRWAKMWQTAAWPIPLRQDGSSYRLRLRVAFACSAVAGDVTFRVGLGQPGVRGGAGLITAAEDFVWEGVADTTTVQWRDGASQLSLNATQIYLPADVVSGMIASRETLSDVGGVPANVRQALVCLHVFAKTTNVTSQPRLYGLYAAEWVGAPGAGL